MNHEHGSGGDDSSKWNIRLGTQKTLTPEPAQPMIAHSSKHAFLHDRVFLCTQGALLDSSILHDQRSTSYYSGHSISYSASVNSSVGFSTDSLVTALWKQFYECSNTKIITIYLAFEWPITDQKPSQLAWINSIWGILQAFGRFHWTCNHFLNNWSRFLNWFFIFQVKI